MVIKWTKSTQKCKEKKGRGRTKTFLRIVTTTVIPRHWCKMHYESLPKTEQRWKHLREHRKVSADASEEKEGVSSCSVLIN